MLTEVLSVLLTLFTLFVLWVRKRYSTFEVQGFLHEKPEFPFGNVRGIGTKYHMIDIIKKIYVKLSKKSPVFGLYVFLRPCYVATDLEVIKDILIRNFDTFHNRGLYNSKENDPLSVFLFTTEDQEWRNMRHKLTPTFSSGKMKMMFNITLDVSKYMIDKLRNETDLEFVKMKPVVANFLVDVIGNVAFGLEMNAINEPDSKFRQMGQKVFTSQNFFARALLLANFKTLARKFGFRLLPKDVTDFFTTIVKETVEYRQANNIERNDVLNMLMKIGTEGREGEEKLTVLEIAAQCFIFFIAGFETSASTTDFVLYNLVNNPDVQDKLRKEIEEVKLKYNNEVTYEGMQEMKYLEMVINETLRMFSPAAAIIRQASRDYKIPNTKLEIPDGSLLFIPVNVIHNDPTYYPEPDKFDPERFSDENKADRHPMAFIPFGDGPRSCIGNRFALMQTKISLIQLLSNFRFHKTTKTADEIAFNPRSPILTSMTEIIIKAEKI